MGSMCTCVMCYVCVYGAYNVCLWYIHVVCLCVEDVYIYTVWYVWYGVCNMYVCHKVCGACMWYVYDMCSLCLYVACVMCVMYVLW